MSSNDYIGKLFIRRSRDLETVFGIILNMAFRVRMLDVKYFDIQIGKTRWWRVRPGDSYYYIDNGKAKEFCFDW